MAFICTLDPEEPLLLTQINSEEGQGETIIRIPIGIDSVSEEVFSVFVCFATIPGYGALRHELVFHVVKAIEGGDETFWSDGLETAHIIPNHMDRFLILNVICLATDKLIDQVGPIEVMMTTHEANLPAKALAKYKGIGSVFVSRGYVPAHPDIYHGRHIWTYTQP